MKQKIVIAPDSFKGSVSAKDAARAIEKGILAGASEKFQTLCFPIADGGEGTLDALTEEKDLIYMTVTGPYFSPVSAAYGMKGDTAIIEMARAAGLTLVGEAERCAEKATTYGVGELMLDALSRGAKKIILTVGGSATNDGGAGMFAALGATFTDISGKSFIPTGGTLANIKDISISSLSPLLSDCRITLATDVKNPLLGAEGATNVYARQKGASDEALIRMERGMAHYASLLTEKSGKDAASVAGCGAGGGLGAPLLSFCRAFVTSGIDAVLSALSFDEAIKDAAAVITGEGKLDCQSLYGKAVSGVVRRAAEANVPAYAFVGCVGDDPEELKKMGLRDIQTLLSLAESPEDSIRNAEKYLYKLGTDFSKKISF